MRSLSPRTAFLALVLGGALAMLAAAQRPARAQDDAPVYLQGNPAAKQLQIDQLREGFEERIRAQREAAEKARQRKSRVARKHLGASVRPNDNVTEGGTVHQHPALPAGLQGVFSIPTNVQVNNPSEAGDGASTTHSEEHIAMSGSFGIAMWNDGNGADGQGAAYTTNGGASWTDVGRPPTTNVTSWFSDPVVGVDEKRGDFYFCSLVSPTSSTNSIGVVRATFPGGVFTFDTPHLTRPGASNSVLSFDKEWFYADSATGNIYVTYTVFSAVGDTIVFQRSTDKGVSWGAPVQISLNSESNLVQGSRPVSGPNGEVYVTYSSIGLFAADYMKIRKSTDGGLSFGAVAVVDSEYSNYGTGAPGFNRESGITFPSIAVDRSLGCHRGRVYETWNESVDYYPDPLGGSSKSEVESNNNFAAATPFTPGMTLRGAISSTDVNDYWKFSATQGTTYIFYLDSLGAAMKQFMQIRCGADTATVSVVGSPFNGGGTLIALSGNGYSFDSGGQQGLIVWTAPTTATYYLRIQRAAGTGTYRINTGVHTPIALDLARDQRDAVVAYSDDGATWTLQNIANDDAAWNDNWFPEVQVTAEGYPYVYWYDFRDATSNCDGWSNLYITRSVNGGGSWVANQKITNVTTNWNTVRSNLVPNQGDYLGMYGGDGIVAMDWADGRNGRPDVYHAKINATYSLACPPDQIVLANTPYTFNFALTNNDVVFGESVDTQFTIDRNWPGFPASGNTALTAGGSGNASITFTVPDTASETYVHLCLTSTVPCSGITQQCCVTLLVQNPATAVLASLASATAEPGRVRLSWSVPGGSSANVERSEDGALWSVLGRIAPDGTGLASFTDTAVRPGASYSYRLAFEVNGRTEYAAETRITVPASAEFALHGTQPNPASNGFAVSFSLPSTARATLEVLDLAGRRVLSKDVTGFGVGRHTVSLQRESAGLRAGIYAVRLLQAGRVANTKVTIVR